MELTEALLLIQQKTFCLIKYPEGVNNQDAQTVFGLRDVLRTGRVQVISAPWETKPLSAAEAEQLLKDFADGNPREAVVHYNPNHVIDVLGTNVPLGAVVCSCKNAYITEEDVAALRLNIEAPDTGVFNARITPFDDKPFDAIYLEWLPIREKAAILKSPMFRVGTLQNAARVLWEITKQEKAMHIVAFVEAIAEAYAYIPNEEESEQATLNPFPKSTEEEMHIALAPIFEELELEAKTELAVMLLRADLLSLESLSETIGMNADDLQKASKAKGQAAS